MTEIAQNQPLIFAFSQPVDRRSVNFTTFSLKTLAGEEPVGQFIVDGSTVSFVPAVRSIQGLTFFGFTANEEYVLTLPGGQNAAAAIVSTAGDRLAASITCNLRVTGGIVDLNQQPPKAKMIAPSTTISVPRNTNIVLEFSELIDFGPFFNVSGTDAPILFKVKKTRPQGNIRVCDPNSREFVLAGSPRLTNDAIRGVTTVSFQPLQSLPGDSCFEVEVTTRVVDLAGTKAVPQVFSFTVEPANVSDHFVVETFDNDLQLDKHKSAGAWSGGKATFATLGGDGRHGSFEITDGERINPTFYRFDTDGTTISPKDDGLVNKEVVVIDGNYYFTDFVLPEEFTLQLIGSKAARIFVRGVCDIRGRIIGSGLRVPGLHNAKNSALVGGNFTPGQGQKGSLAGPGGGLGGDGAFACDGKANPNQPQFNDFNGFDGGDATVPAGHAFQPSQLVGTGGKGSALWPAHGDETRLTFQALAGTYAVEAASGGGGGGYRVGGGDGRVLEGGYIAGEPPTTNITNPGALAPDTKGGIALPPLFPIPSGQKSGQYFLIGGGGGGGGGSEPTFSHKSALTDPFKFWSGGAGAGGGGALGLRIGNKLTMATGSLIACDGATGDSSANSFTVGRTGAPTPGGGGAGGSILLQVAGEFDISGRLSALGGAGIPLKLVGFFAMNSFGGAASDGFLRLEVPEPNPPVSLLSGKTSPPATAENVAQLLEKDTFAGFMSLWYDTLELFPPDYVRYEIEALVGGVPRLFSDDPSVPNSTPARAGSGPVVFYVQGVDLEPGTGLPAVGAELQPWRKLVGPYGSGLGEIGLSSDATTGFRWVVLIDHSMATSVEITKVSVVFRS